MMKTTKRPNFFMRPKRDRRTTLEKMQVKLRNLSITGHILASGGIYEFDARQFRQQKEGR